MPSLFLWLIYRHKLMSREYHCAAHVLFVFTHLARQLISIHVHRVHCTPCVNWNVPFSNNLPSAYRKFCLVSRNSSLRVRIESDLLSMFTHASLFLSTYRHKLISREYHCAASVRVIKFDEAAEQHSHSWRSLYTMTLQSLNGIWHIHLS